MSDEPNMMGKATSHLWLIKARFHSLTRILDDLQDQEVSVQYVVTLDHAFLDIRKIIEELMLLSVCAHDFASVELTSKLRKEWHAERIIKYLENINPQFFPEAIEVIASEEPDIAGILSPSPHQSLNKKDVVAMYNFCGDVLHATNKRNDVSIINGRYRRAVEFLEKISVLLNCFQIDIFRQRNVGYRAARCG